MHGRLPALAGMPAGHALFFAPGKWRGPDEPAEPAPRPRSRHETFWTWATVALIVAALLLPFSLAALLDLLRYLSR